MATLPRFGCGDRISPRPTFAVRINLTEATANSDHGWRHGHRSNARRTQHRCDKIGAVGPYREGGHGGAHALGSAMHSDVLVIGAGPTGLAELRTAETWHRERDSSDQT